MYDSQAISKTTWQSVNSSSKFLDKVGQEYMKIQCLSLEYQVGLQGENFFAVRIMLLLGNGHTTYRYHINICKHICTKLNHLVVFIQINRRWHPLNFWRVIKVSIVAYVTYISSTIFFCDRILKCSPGRPSAFYVAQDWLELMIFLPQPLGSWDCRHVSPCPDLQALHFFNFLLFSLKLCLSLASLSLFLSLSNSKLYLLFSQDYLPYHV
jgi:hypothetical protein